MFDFVEPRVRRVVADQLGVGTEELGPDVSLVDDLAADSLDLVELGLALEYELGVAVPDSVIEHLRTYGDLVDSLRVLSSPIESTSQTRQRPVFPVSARIVSGRHGGELCIADVLTPYAMQSLVDDALGAGRGARLEVTVPSDLSDARLALLEEDLGWLGKRGVQVHVCRDQAGPSGARLEATRHRPYAARRWLGARSSYTGRF